MKYGLELFLERKAEFRTQTLGIVTNHTAVDHQLNHLITRLQKEDLQIEKIFSPEHGLYGVEPAGKKIKDTDTLSSGMTIQSLYGEQRKPALKDLEGLDLLVYDIQDVGVRFYTYIYTMANTMQAAAEKGIPFIVLDRPNPLRGDIVQGRPLPPSYSSFVGAYQLPIRYGLTPGELALYINEEYGIGADLMVATLKGWKRDAWYDSYSLAWIPPSPNIPTLQTALLYPGTCLIEGTNLSEGRGTTIPFHIVGAPWLETKTVKEKLAKTLPAAVKARQTRFRPRYAKYAGELCAGIQFHIGERTFNPIQIGVSLIWIIRNTHPKQFAWRKLNDSYIIDRLTGGSSFREHIDEGNDLESTTSYMQAHRGGFIEKKQQYHLYPNEAGSIHRK